MPDATYILAINLAHIREITPQRGAIQRPVFEAPDSRQAQVPSAERADVRDSAVAHPTART